MNNLRQIGIAIHGFTADHDDCLPQSYDGTTVWYSTWSGSGLLRPYVTTATAAGTAYGKLSVFWCLSNPNGYAGQVNYVSNDDVMGWGSAPYNLSRYKQPARCILVLDASTVMGSAWPGYHVGNGTAANTLFPTPHRDGTMQNVLYLDGHVELVKQLNRNVDFGAF